MPVVGTKAAASSQGFGEFAQSSGPANYIEDVFSTWLYTGNGSTQTITNGIDLAGKGGLVWVKDRTAANSNGFWDTARGAGSGPASAVNNALSSNLTAAQGLGSSCGYVSNFGSTGFSVANGGATAASTALTNLSGDTYASWTFRKQPKFFDVVTFTSNASGGATINHSLASAPGCVIVKSTAAAGNWFVYHVGMDPAEYMFLNTTAAAANGGRTVTTSSTQVTYPSGYFANSTAYVAYLFASNSGGFGLTGTDNVISCGVYTGNGSANGPTVTLNYEPQWLLIKKADGSGGAWWIADTMRGFDNTSDQFLWANSATSEIPKTNYVKPTATGFQIVNTDFDVNESGARYIYIAIRRGPMKTPTSGTSVFSAKTYSATTSSAQVTHDVTFDAEINANRDSSAGAKFLFVDSLRGINGTVIQSASTSVEFSYPTYWSRKDQRTMYAPSAFDAWWASNSGTQSHISYGLVRAPGFFDEVCYTGDGGSNRALQHNLQAVPELVIIKCRSIAADWMVWTTSQAGKGANLNSTLQFYANANIAGSSTWTSSTIYIKSPGYDADGANGTGQTYVAYLFASCPGVSKVGSYTGTGAAQTISCGFAARFVLIKRTNSTGDWWVWDTARGMVAGTDPRLAYNSNAVETNANWVYTNASGFQIVTTDATVNASGGTYIYLAIA